MAVRLNADRAKGVNLRINLAFTDQPKPWLMVIERSVLHAFEGRRDEHPTATLRLTSKAFKRMMVGITTPLELLQNQALTLEGDAAALMGLGGLFDQFERRFPIVTPRKMP